MAGVPIVAQVVDVDADAARRIQLAENIHREDLGLMDKAKAVRGLYDELGTMQAVADLVKKSKAWVSKLVGISEGLGYWGQKLIEEGVTEDLEIIRAMEAIDKLAPAGTNTSWSTFENIKSKGWGRDEVLAKVKEIKGRIKEDRERALKQDEESKKRETERLEQVNSPLPLHRPRRQTRRRRRQ